jgi:hypothetical protein
LDLRPEWLGSQSMSISDVHPYGVVIVLVAVQASKSKVTGIDRLLFMT